VDTATKKVLTAQLHQGGLQTRQTTHALVVDEDLGHLAHRWATLFVKGHALGFTVNFDFLKRQ
jgi:hypothetical protein